MISAIDLIKCRKCRETARILAQALVQILKQHKVASRRVSDTSLTAETKQRSPGAKKNQKRTHAKKPHARAK